MSSRSATVAWLAATRVRIIPEHARASHQEQFQAVHPFSAGPVAQMHLRRVPKIGPDKHATHILCVGDRHRPGVARPALTTARP